jgi:hypothetical protein
MRTTSVRISVGVALLTVCAGAAASAQTMEKVDYFPDAIAEKDDHLVRLNGGSSWLLASRTSALVAANVLVVMRDVDVNGQRVSAAWLFVGGEEIPVKHVEGVYPRNPAYLTRVVAADGGTTLRLADGSVVMVPKYDRFSITRWTPPYKALLTGNRTYLYNLKVGRRVWIQPATK